MSSSEAGRPVADATRQALELLSPGSRPERLEFDRGYIDLLGDGDATGRHPGQRLMTSRMLPVVYERLWRPTLGRLLMGAIGPGTDDERKLALEMLELSAGERVLDVGCGLGNFARVFARAAGGGLVVGLDASRTMLDRAARETQATNLAYVRGDAAALPFRDESFQAVCCFAALYPIEEPLKAVDEIVRVLAPGGRVAVLSSINRGLLPAAARNAIVRGLSGVRIFARDELTHALAQGGLTAVEQRVSGFGQFISARKPAAQAPH